MTKFPPLEPEDMADYLEQHKLNQNKYCQESLQQIADWIRYMLGQSSTSNTGEKQ